MRRADRLFEIIQLLRRGRVVTARTLAERLEVSERTIYRDVQHLIGCRVPIEGEAGVGYVLRKGYDLPPLMFPDDELEALVFGARIVQRWTDSELARAAGAALERIAVVLPEHLRRLLDDPGLWAPVAGVRPPLRFDLATLRRAIRERRALRIRYRDREDTETSRAIRPLTLWFYGPVWLVGAWCELRVDFRFFRLDRISAVRFLKRTFVPEPGRTVEDLMQRVIARRLA